MSDNTGYLAEVTTEAERNDEAWEQYNETGAARDDFVTWVTEVDPDTLPLTLRDTLFSFWSQTPDAERMLQTWIAGLHDDADEGFGR